MKMNTTHSMAAYLQELQQCLELVSVEQIAKIADLLETAYREDRLIAIVGNGGSAATASHMACDLGKTILGSAPSPTMRRFRVLALTDNVPLITAWANDVDYESIFAEQIRCWVAPGDVVIVISGSGNSANICTAVQAARELGAYTIGFLGFDGGRIRDMVDTSIVVPSNNYGHIEDIHAIFGHMLTTHMKKTVADEQAGVLPVHAKDYIRDKNSVLDIAYAREPQPDILLVDRSDPRSYS